MTRIVVDATPMTKLHQLSDSLELCDEQRRVLGYFTPAARREPTPRSPDELQRRLAEPGGRSIPDILAEVSRRP